MTDYREFLESKFKFSVARGFEVAPDEVNPALKPITQTLARWAVRGGRRAIFASFGLHKTATQLEIMRLIGVRRPAAMRLIVLPLGVRQEFIREAALRFTGEHALSLKFIRSTDEIDGAGTIYLTNYESVRDGKLDPNHFDAASLDEASVLRSFGSKTYQEFLSLFGDVEFKFVATATPSPNRYKELIHYAGFLGIMDTGQALTRFFQRDPSKAGNLTLYPHMEKEFFVWLHSWAIFLQKPSDLGFSDDGYDLPPLKVNYHEVRVANQDFTFDRDGRGKLMRDASMGLRDAAEEKRRSIPDRVAKMRQIIDADPDAHFILWHDLEAERHAIRAAVPDAAEVYGALDLEEREARTIAFSDGEIKRIATKPELSGSGTNWQRHCRRAIFVGITYSFNDFIQAIHRILRFGQLYQCEIDIIYTEAEREVLATLQRKWAEDEALRRQMAEIIRKHGLATTGLEHELARTIGCEREVVIGKRFEVARNDCVEECRLMDDESVDLIVTSIPFGNHYEYSESYNDFGHNDNNARFFEQMDYLTPHLLRVLRPGRIAAIHVKDRILFGNVTGYGFPAQDSFHEDVSAHFRRHGFIKIGMITVVTDVVRENNQTYRLGWSEQCKDGTKMGVGCPEYVLLFRKLQTDRSKGYADVPVEKSKATYTRARWQLDAHSFWRSSGDRAITPADLEGLGPDRIGKLYARYSATTVYNFEEHVALGETLDARHALPSTFMCLAPASPAEHVWHDVNRMRTLNGSQTQRGLQNHICPLQFDIIDRLITRYSNPDELVFDSFGGLFTVPYRAIRLGRRGRACELNRGYFLDGVEYCRSAEAGAERPSLFDLIEAVEPEIAA